MASIVDGGEETMIEGQRTSLLDVIEERNRTLNKKTLLHRIVMISTMYHQNYTEISQYYERLFKDMQNQYQIEGVTGLLLLFPKTCIHVVETSEEVILDLVRDLRRQSGDNQTHLEKSKILVVSHNIPHRLYQHWSHRVIDIDAPSGNDYEPSDSVEATVTDMLTQLLKLGVHLARQPKVSLKSAMDSLHESRPDLLPDQMAVQYLVNNDYTDCIINPEEYLDMYERPFDVILDSELVWPMPTKLFPYN